MDPISVWNLFKQHEKLECGSEYTFVTLSGIQTLKNGNQYVIGKRMWGEHIISPLLK